MSDQEAFKKLPRHEQILRRRLGKALTGFGMKIMEMMKEDLDEKKKMLEMGVRPDEESEMDYDAVERLARDYAVELEWLAERGVECSLAWYNLAFWTGTGKERIGYFSRTLACVEEGKDSLPGSEPGPAWSGLHTRAECLYEIGRVHAHEGDAAVARDFLMRAQPLAQEAERLRSAAGVAHEDHLEGKIAELLVQLPD